MPIDPAALRAEITTDPAGLGYAPLVAAGADAGIAALLGATTGPGAAPIALPSVSRDAFLLGLRPAYMSLPTLPAAVQQKWDRILAAINSGAAVAIDAGTQGLLASAVADGVLTQAQADAVWHRTGSRAEVLFGPDTVMTQADVSFALRGLR